MGGAMPGVNFELAAYLAVAGLALVMALYFAGS